MNLEEIFEKGKHDALIFKKPYGEVHIPEDYIAHGIATIIGQEIETFGLFDVTVYENEDQSGTPTVVHFTFPSVIRTSPSHIELKRGADGNEYVLQYGIGDRFINSTLIAQQSAVARMFIDTLFKGYIPDSLPYDKLLQFWSDCNAINGVNLNVLSVVLQTILSEFARDPVSPEYPFRMALNDKKRNVSQLDRLLVRVMDLPRFNSTFASLSSADPKQGITMSVVRRRMEKSDNPSPVEDAIL